MNRKAPWLPGSFFCGIKHFPAYNNFSNKGKTKWSNFKASRFIIFQSNNAWYKKNLLIKLRVL